MIDGSKITVMFKGYHKSPTESRKSITYYCVSLESDQSENRDHIVITKHKRRAENKANSLRREGVRCRIEGFKREFCDEFK